MSLAFRVIIVSVIDIVVTDSALYYSLKYRKKTLTLPLLIGLIFITLLPIVLAVLAWEIEHPQ